MLSEQNKGNVLPPQQPHIAKTVHFDGVFRRRWLRSRHVANDRAILLAKCFHSSWIH